MRRGVFAVLRGTRWGILVAVAALVLFWQVCARTHHGPTSDGFYTWLYTRSLVYDHDIDFTNDYKLCGDPHHQKALRGTAHPDNPFYVGPSVVWVPVLYAVRAVSHVDPGDPACRGVLAERTLRVAPLLGALTVWLLYLIGRRFSGDGVAALSAGLLGMGTPLLEFAGSSTSYSHVYDAFWAACSVLAALRASERPALGRWALAGALVGVNLLQRPVSVLYGVVPGVLAIASAPPPRFLRAAGPLAALGAGVALFGLLPQALIYKYLYGHYWVGAPAGRYFMQYGHAHPWLLLFAPRGGLFFASPVVWLAVPGLVVGLRQERTRALTGSLIVAVAATIWLSSACIDWFASWSFGARRLTSIVALLAPPMAMALARIARWLEARRSRPIRTLAVAACAGVALSTCGERDVVTGEHGQSQEELYGGAAASVWSWVDRRGDLAILPAEEIFYRRYGLPWRAFRAATEPCCGRDFRTMAKPVSELTLKAHPEQVTGFAKDGDDFILGKRATFVFTPEWPHATDIFVSAEATSGAKLRVGRGTLGGTVWFGERSFGPGASTQQYAVPAGGYDSGLLELVFERADGDGGGQVIVRSIRIEDNAKYGPAL